MAKTPKGTASAARPLTLQGLEPQVPSLSLSLSLSLSSLSDAPRLGAAGYVGDPRVVSMAQNESKQLVREEGIKILGEAKL